MAKNKGADSAQIPTPMLANPRADLLAADRPGQLVGNIYSLQYQKRRSAGQATSATEAAADVIPCKAIRRSLRCYFDAGAVLLQT